jgi:CHAT domain-containing protein/tetratricopeptide (TPR) repeat protein
LAFLRDCLVLVMLCGFLPAAGAETGGARVRSVDPALGAAAAGLAAGDRLVAARAAGGSRLEIRDPFDALVAETRWSRLGTIDIERAGRDAPTRLRPDQWGLDYETATDADSIAALDALEAAKNIPEFCRLATEAGASLPPRASGWLDWRCARMAAGARDWALARSAFARAQGKLGDDGDARLALTLAYARLAQAGKEWTEFDAVTAVAPGETEAAEIRWQLREQIAYALAIRSRFAESAALLEALLAEVPAAFRDTPMEAYALVDHGFALRQLERFAEAEHAYLRALAVLDRVAPVSNGAAAGHMSLGSLRRVQGQLSEARNELQQAVAITRRIAPGSVRVASTLNNLSLVLWDEGDYVGAERALAEALDIHRKLGPEGYDVAVTLQNLGAIALDRGDFAVAEPQLRRSQEIFERVAPESNSLAIGYHYLALIDANARDYAAAERNYGLAIQLYAKLAPGTLREAWSHHNLGNNARDQGRLDEARRHYEDAQAIRAKVAPGGLDEASGFSALASLEIAQGNRLAGRGNLGLARNTLQKLAPESGRYAAVLHSLGELERDEGNRARALELFCEADRVLDLQRLRVSTSRESQSEYAAQYYAIPRDCALARLDAGEPGDALDVIERSRARALRERLGDFRVAFAGIPAPLRDERTDLTASRARLEARLSSPAPGAGAADREQARRELAALEARESAWRARLAKQAPSVARALDLPVAGHDDVLAALPADTAIVVYLAGTPTSRAWLLSGAQRRIAVAELSVDEAGLERLAAGLREAIVARAPESRVRELARQADATLLGPFAEPLKQASRLLVVPDRGMTLLPYAALVEADGRFLLENHDVAIAPSIAVAVEASTRPTTPAASLAAVAVTRARGFDRGPDRIEFAAIPAAAGEVSAIATAYAPRAEVLIDHDATEDKVRTAAAGASVLHIASHGFFDAAHPLESGLLLEPGAGSDGVLHAWEVMAGWRLDGNPLVVLSACDTGVGEDRAGEGLVGLGRAFQYAGAQGVVASLWPVADRSTAGLMRDFHRSLLRGERPAAALQAAQRALLASGEAPGAAIRGVGALQARDRVSLRHPFYWAGFETFGQLP